MATLAMTRFYQPNVPYVFSSQPRVLQNKRRSKSSKNSEPDFYNLKNESSFKLSPTNKSGHFYQLSSYGSYLEKKKSPYKLNSSSWSESIDKNPPITKKSGKKVAWSGQGGGLYGNRRSASTPEPVEGRQHVQLQTELYLEELSEMVIEEDQVCQTDTFLNKPSTPNFVPAKTGIDVATEILEGELFDFDVEVKPIVEVLVGKVTEQALLEVMQEEELELLRERQRVFEEIRNAEKEQEQKLEEEERRRREEKLKRIKHHQEMIKKEKETAEKIAAKAFSQGFLSDLVPSVINSLSENGFFHDPVELELEKNFMEDLMRGVSKKLRYEVISRKLLDGIIRDVLRKREEDYLKSLKNGRQSRISIRSNSVMSSKEI